MGQRHKHADVIIAWAEGKDVQVWSPVNNRWEAVEKRIPDFLEWNKYRVKPPAKNYRVALLRKLDEMPFVVAANSQATADSLETQPSFVRWLTDWVEYEE